MYFKHINWLCKGANGLEFFTRIVTTQRNSATYQEFWFGKTGKKINVPIISLNGEYTPNVVWLLHT